MINILMFNGFQVLDLLECLAELLQLLVVILTAKERGNETLDWGIVCIQDSIGSPVVRARTSHAPAQRRCGLRHTSTMAIHTMLA
jgi:hypothetical protein